MRKHIYILFLSLLFVACIEDGISVSPAHQPTFSTDTLALGEVFSGEGVPTAAFKVYNPHPKGIMIGRVALEGENAGMFRMNVDGISGNSFENIEVRAGDSIFVFIEATFPDRQLSTFTQYLSHISFTTNGVTRQVAVTATAIDAVRLRSFTTSEEDCTLAPSRPYIIYDTLRVANGTTLTLPAGTKLHFHDRAALVVDGTLKSLGTPDAQVEMTGDRMGTVVGRVDYEIMSGQWDGVVFTPSSKDNHLEYTSIRNTSHGVYVDSVPYSSQSPSITMLNCQLRNSKEYSLAARHSRVVAMGCEIADAAMGAAAFSGGEVALTNCTLSNYFLFSALGGPILQFYRYKPDVKDETSTTPLLKADINNCIIYGLGADLNTTDLDGTQIRLTHCLLKSSGNNDNNFVDCIWDTDPLFYTDRPKYLFDYRLRPESAAIGNADPALIPAELTVDRLGVPRLPSCDLGAYSYTTPTSKQKYDNQTQQSH